jgi:beta-glucuronidase
MKRSTLDLTGTWYFRPDPCNDGEVDRYFAPAPRIAQWRKVTVPCTLESCLPSHDWYEGAGWFRRTVRVPATWRGRRVAVRFEGVNYHAKVWINGREAGEHRDGFLPFEFRIDHLLRPGESNVIAVRADNERLDGEVPGLKRGWRPYGGPLREVRLIATNRLYLTPPHVTAGADGTLLVVSSARNETDRLADARLEGEVRDARGDVVARLPRVASVAQPGHSCGLGIACTVPDVEPWSPEDPALYTARLRLRSAGKIVDSLDVRFGFRTIEAAPDGLRLNGKRIFLTGFNRHEDSPRTGPCTDLAQAREDLLAMKRAGSNFVRLCHYPHHPGELDLCDELGLLVMGEIPLYWWKVPWGVKQQEKGGGCDARTMASARRQLEGMIRRDRHHPSVVFWSVSNECAEARAVVQKGNAALVRLAKKLDPSRLAVHVSCFWQEHPHFEADDVVCVNAYPNWSSRERGTGRQSTDTPLKAGGRAWRTMLAALHRKYPDKPILVTEFGYPSLEGFDDGAMGEGTQARSIEAELAGMDAPYVCGTTIWCWADHPWPEEDFSPTRLTTSPYGVVTRDRRPLKALGVVSRLFHHRQRNFPRRPVRENSIGSA